MGVVPSAVAALDAHRGSEAVAGCGMCFLWMLASAAENKVMMRRLCGVESGCGVCAGWCVSWGLAACMFVYGLAVLLFDLSAGGTDGCCAQRCGSVGCTPGVGEGG
jgi:hypothetical protein